MLSPEEITNRVASQEVIGKLIAYHDRFGDVGHYESKNHDIYLLPVGICRRELKRAESQLLYEGRRVKSAELVPTDLSPNELEAIEINTDGRRFAILRDICIEIPSREILEAETAVVSVLDESRWPADIYSGLSQEAVRTLKGIANSPLIDDVRNLAIYLQLGDRVPFIKNNPEKQMLYARTLEKFGLSDIDEVKKILKLIGLKIIDTSSRIEMADSVEESRSPHSKLGSKAISSATRSSGGSELSVSAKTEVDALMEAIHKTK